MLRTGLGQNQVMKYVSMVNSTLLIKLVAKENIRGDEPMQRVVNAGSRKKCYS